MLLVPQLWLLLCAAYGVHAIGRGMQHKSHMATHHAPTEIKTLTVILPDSVCVQSTEIIQQCLVLQLVDVDTLHVYMIHV